MIASEERINANRSNAHASTGPRTEPGKSASKANSLKHGMSGSGAVIPPGDVAAVEDLARKLQAEFNAKSAVGMLMVRQLALLSIRMDRAAEHETAAIAMQVRHAVEAFDDERFEAAERLLDSIGEEPRINLRKLLKTPEGVDRLIVAWCELYDDLNRESRPVWTAWHLERAVNLLGQRIDAAQGSIFNDLSKAVWGDFRAIEDLEKEDRKGDARKAEARKRLMEQIMSEVVALQSHRETLDLEMIELDRAEAGSRALFDPSKEATLARRYASEARRNFFKTLNELRRVEAEYAARPEPQVVPEMGSSRESAPPVPPEPTDPPAEESSMPGYGPSRPARHRDVPVLTADGQFSRPGKPPTPEK